MSLSSLLLSSGPKKIDKELDDLFKSNPVPPRKPATPIQAPIPGSAPPAKKRKIEAAIPDPPHSEKKRVKAANPVKPPKPSPKAVKPPAKTASSKKSKSKEVVVEAESDLDSVGSEEDDEDNSDLENAYLGKKKGTVAKSTAPPADEDEDEGEGEGEDDRDESGDSDSDPPPVHESLAKRVRTKPTKKAKIVPEGETSAQRDARTLFIGGLPVDVAQKKPLQKQLSRHLLTFLPSSSKVKIESTRFRSVAFRDPTSSTAHSSPATTSPAPKVNANSIPIPPSSNHSKTRASTWRQTTATDAKTQAAAEGDAQKEYLTPAQKKKILFIQGAFHPEANGVNAYVVLAHHTEDSADSDTPYAAAQHIARAGNSSEFMGRALRVDVCGRLPDADAEGGGPSGDPKLSIFIGNLDFASRESDVREFFEGVVAAERGPAPAESEDGNGRWVEGVRLIRDRETQLGKGFGYVRFLDRECVDEILALGKTDEGKVKLKFAKRTLRVQRCRAGAASSSAAKSAGAAPASKSKSTFPPTPPKRGDPTLGARLAHLDKDARKAAKKADADRVSRRAEKKKMGTRMRTGAANDKIRAVAGGGGKRVGGGGKGGSNDKGKGMDRERERKVRVSKNAGGAKGRK
ncbi:hypothetical protein FB451DRAFT_1119450 [Mycena latifolia]|nr:hypothetical protein FB451DRAFT_1119450 [Mycena latifolia]